MKHLREQISECSLFYSSVFKPTADLLLSAMETIHEGWQQDKIELDECWYLSFIVNDITIMMIYCQHYSTGGLEVGVEDETFFKREEILQNLPQQNLQLIRIPEKNWFAKLNKEAQLHVLNGTNLIDKYLSMDENDISDFSPFLLSFLKAAEAEIQEHYNKYETNIISISKIVCALKSNKPIGFSFTQRDNKKDLNSLFYYATKIVKEESNNGGFETSGIKPLYYFLKYYALRTELESVINFDSYLTDSQLQILNGVFGSLNKILQLGDARNAYIHQQRIDNKEAFIVLYDSIRFTLSLLSELKQNSSVSPMHLN